jgi:hypothetical protein
MMYWKLIILSLLAIVTRSEDTPSGKGYRTVAYFVDWYVYLYSEDVDFG